MPIDLNSLEVHHNSQAERFEIRLDEQLAVLEYRLDGNTLNLKYTGVPRALEGKGIGGRLAKAALEYARENSFRVIPSCSFINAYLRRHPEYQNLVDK